MKASPASPKKPIRFEPDSEKLIQAISFFADKGVRDLTTLKIVKLLYFADKQHFLKHGRPITGDQYVCMDNGPVASRAYDLLKGAVGSASSVVWTKNHSYFEKFLRVVPPASSSGKHTFAAKAGFDRAVFSDSDLEILSSVVTEYGGLSVTRLWKLAHEATDYKLADAKRAKGSSTPMPFETFLSDLSRKEAREQEELIRQEQEDREFARNL